MLDLLVAGDAVREKTAQSVANHVKSKQTTKHGRRRRGALRSSSAAALRGLANRIEPSRADAVPG
jgi:hypothetical protein